MDKKIDANFDRMDKALATLLESIARYNPSSHSGEDLLAADAELSKGLEELQTHQQNHAHITHLRNISANLDAQIKETLTLLAQTRKELVNTSATVFPDGPSHPIKYEELLAFARRISKTTLPSASAAERISALSRPPIESGAETATTTPGGTPQVPTNGTQSTLDPALQISTTNGATELPEHLSAQMNPLLQTDFVPWPTEDHVRFGALASMAYLIEKGIDPENYDPAEEEARKKLEEEEAREREERERIEREEQERKFREQREKARREAEAAREKEGPEAWRRGSVGVGGAAAGAPSGGAGERKQFQFMADDDDESD